MKTLEASHISTINAVNKLRLLTNDPLPFGRQGQQQKANYAMLATSRGPPLGSAILRQVAEIYLKGN
jgi:hypothetical protein